jgi:hypothetical protein
MRNRIETVEKAHEESFKWIFADDNRGDSGPGRVALFNERNREGADSFVKWLSSGNGAYHIAGKLGSGKSTLMKYLCGHSRVREELQKWAGR